MRKFNVLNKRRKIVSELKKLIEMYKFGDNANLASEKVDLSKYRKINKETKQNFKFFSMDNNNSVYKTRR